MSDLTLPAPIWRRLAAFTYDSLLYVAMLMAGLVLANFVIAVAIAKNANTPLHNLTLLPLYGYGIGVIVFAWSWAKGGQTLGMRAWRIQVRRLDGQRLRWPIALVRLTCSYLLLALALWVGLRMGAALPPGKARVLSALQLLPWAFLAYYVPCLISTRGRSFSDLLTGTEVIALPRAGKISSPVES
ncbi:MAG: RDD family protein [Pseudomonadota bacterium]